MAERPSADTDTEHTRPPCRPSSRPCPFFRFHNRTAPPAEPDMAQQPSAETDEALMSSWCVPCVTLTRSSNPTLAMCRRATRRQPTGRQKRATRNRRRRRLPQFAAAGARHVPQPHGTVERSRDRPEAIPRKRYRKNRIGVLPKDADYSADRPSQSRTVWSNAGAITRRWSPEDQTDTLWLPTAELTALGSVAIPEPY